MKGTEDTRQRDRYIALGIHKEYVLAGEMNAEQVWVLPPGRIVMGKFRDLARLFRFSKSYIVNVPREDAAWISA